MSMTRIQRLRARHRMMRALRAFFDARGFTEITTPSLVCSPGLDVHVDALAVQVGKATRYLHTSPEYAMKRLLSEGSGPIYQVCKAFRRDERGLLHDIEFSMLEWYSPGLDMNGLIAQTEALVAFAAQAINDSAIISAQEVAIDLTPPWPRLSVREAFLQYASVAVEDVLPNEELFFRLLIDKVEPALPQDRPTVLHSYPASMASLARLSQADRTVADRFEVYIRGVELCNGFAELTDPVEQRARLQADQAARERLGKEVYPMDERFLAALEQGLPACAGNALGLDRLAMLLLGASSIDDVMTFTSDDC